MRAVPGWGKLGSQQLLPPYLFLHKTLKFLSPKVAVSLPDVGIRVQRAMQPTLSLQQGQLPRRNEQHR